MRSSAQVNRGEAKASRLARALWATLASITLVATGTGLAYATDLDSLSGGDTGTEDGTGDGSGIQSFNSALEDDGTGEGLLLRSNELLTDQQQSDEDTDQQSDDDQQIDNELDVPQSENKPLSRALTPEASVELLAAPGTATVKVTARVVSPSNTSGTTGIGFELYDGNTPTGYTCSIVSDAGECTIEVPTAGLGKAYRVVQTSTPSNLFANPQFYVQGSSGGAGSATRQINYPAGLTPVLQSTNEVSMPVDAVIAQTGGATPARDRSLGNVLSSRYNVPRNTCVAVDVAGLIDVSTSISDTQLAQYRNGIKQGIDGLIDTGATLQMFTFGTVSPASGTSPSPRLLVTATNAITLKNWVDVNIQRSVVGTQYTNWASGIQAVQSAGASDQFTAMLLVTDGAPNRPTSDNMSDTNVRALEEAIYAANSLKGIGTRSIGVGIGLGGGVAQTNLRAVSDPSNFYNVADFAGLGDLLTSLGTDLTTCNGTVSITKYQGNGPDDPNKVLKPGWTVNTVLDNPATGVAINPTTSQQTGAAGEAAKWTITMPTESSTFNVTVSETTDATLPFQTGRYRVVAGTPGPWVNFDTTSKAITGLVVGDDVEVEFYNNEIPATPEWTLTKSSNPVSESTVKPGDKITYTLTATNTSTKATLTGATAEDDLSNVLNNAVLTQPLASGLSLAGTRLTWDVPTLAPGANASVSYEVTVNAGALGVTIGNVVTAGDEVPPPTNCDEDGVCGETEHYTPAWDLTKSSNPASGSTVDPGATITYTLTAKNTSSKATLAGATAEDDLSEVLNNATLVQPLAAGLTLNGTKLTWNFGTLAAGATATVSYQVVVNQNAVGVTIGNVVTGKGVIPPNPCPENNTDCRETEHHTPSWSLVKSSNPADGSTVNPGSNVTYTLTAKNTSDTATLRGLTITDNLSGVLNNATKVGGPTATTGVVLYNPVLPTQLVWTISELAPGATATATYTVKINDGAYGVTIANVATPQGPVPPEPCPTNDQTCRETEHYTPAWDLTKSSDPATGSTVKPGDTITYTLTAKNTSSKATLTGAKASDNLSNVLDNAALVQPLAAGLSLSGTTLTWDFGTLAPGATKSVSYQVTVNEDALGVTIGNVVTGTGNIPPNPCPESNLDCRETEHFTPAWDLTKSSNPATGSTVKPGDKITYTLTATNTSEVTDLKGAQASDNLSNVLNNAVLTQPLPAGLTLSGTTLTWAIPDLEPGDSTSVSYEVTVNAGAYGVTIGNVVTGSGDVPPGPCDEEDPNCRETEHFTPAWDLTKSSDPASGSTVNPGDTVTYTLTAKNTSSKVALEGATAEDDLSEVLNNATLVQPLAAGLTLNGTKLTWSFGTLAAGATATVSYQVVVDDDAVGVTIGNVVTGKGDIPPNPCPESNADCRETEHFTPEWTLTKASNPESGSTVAPGSEITYTLTAKNTSENGVLKGAKGVDDLSNVLNNAVLTEPLAAGLALSGTTLTWTIPDLDPGESASVSYKVTVDEDAVGVTIGNVVTSGGDVPPPTNCEADEPCGETEHYTPAWDLTKSSDPASGSTVVPGDKITYTLTAKNTTENAILKGATGVDDLSNVLNNATLTEPLASGLALSGTTLTWTIPDLDPGESASVSYEVTVDEDAIDVTIGNVVTGGGDVPPNPCTEEDPDCRETEHFTPEWTLTKASDPESGSTVAPGSEITYTLTATNTSENGVLSGAKGIDDLSNVLNNAVLTEPLASGLALSGTTLTWTIPDLDPGESVSVNYKVTVDEDAVGVSIGNVVTFGGDVPPPTDCEVGEPCGETEHFTPEWDLVKSSDPASGSTVVPGDKITYTLTATNTSENAVLKGAKGVDDLSKVLNNATLSDPLAAGLVLDGTTLTWTIPDLEPGESVSVDYVVTVNANADGVDLANVVTGEGPVPPNPCSEEDQECRETDHHTPAWSLQKSSNPKSGSAVSAGQTVTYTLTAKNTSNATVEGAKAVDDLSKVLSNATLVTPLDGSLKLDGTSLTWSLPTLKPGETATMSYKVKVKDIKTSISLVNVVKPATPGGECVANQCSTNHSSKLPDTGANAAMPLAIGAGLLLLGGLGFGVSRRQKRGNNV